MKRRALLARSATLGAVGLAGCVSSGDPGSDTPDDTETPTPEPPEIDTTAIETRGTDCGTGDHGSVDALDADAGNHRLTIRGTVGASNPCYLAELTATELDDGTLSVTVGTRRDETVDVCADCVGVVEYEAAVTLTAGLAAEVVVHHEAFGEGAEVARETVEL